MFDLIFGKMKIDENSKVEAGSPSMPSSQGKKVDKLPLNQRSSKFFGVKIETVKKDGVDNK